MQRPSWLSALQRFLRRLVGRRHGSEEARGSVESGIDFEALRRRLDRDTTDLVDSAIAEAQSYVQSSRSTLDSVGQFELPNEPTA